jgi:uncharacterized protein (TIGR00645 family)
MTRRRIFNPIEWLLEAILFNSRWLLAPFYLGLISVIGVLGVVFFHELVTEAQAAIDGAPDKAVLLVLDLIDLSLAANLVMIVTFSGYENFISKINTGNSPDRPSWMGKVDFSGLKIRVIASIVAISAIALLKSFMELAEGVAALHGGKAEPVDNERLAWMVGIHITFIVSGVLLALMDLLTAKAEALEASHTESPKTGE